jgi:hypothetical protein
MKPFNLEEALAGKPVCTRDGRPAKIAGYNPDAVDACSMVLGWVGNVAWRWHISGVDPNGGKYTKNRDLFMVSEKHKEHKFGIIDCEGVLSKTFPDSTSAHRALGEYIKPARVVEVTLEWED